jgi:hypothetical protein
LKNEVTILLKNEKTQMSGKDEKKKMEDYKDFCRKKSNTKK